MAKRSTELLTNPSRGDVWVCSRGGNKNGGSYANLEWNNDKGIRIFAAIGIYQNKTERKQLGLYGRR